VHNFHERKILLKIKREILLMLSLLRPILMKLTMMSENVLLSAKF